MIQSPQLNFAPQMPAQNQYPQGMHASAPQQSAQMPGVIYNYPAANAYPAAAQTPPKYNGVNIGIKNPQGSAPSGGYGSYGNSNGYGAGYGCIQPQNQGQFNGVNIEIINPQGMGQPIGAMLQPQMPAQFYPQQLPQMPAYQPARQGYMMPQIMPPMPGMQQPPFIQQPALPAPAAQSVTEPLQNQVKAPEIPAPVIQQPPAQTPVIGAPVEPVSSVNPEIFAGRLRTHNMDEQKAAIEEVAEKVKNSDTDGPVLLDTQIFDALVDIINRDTSPLAGPSPEVMQLRQKDPADLTPSEKEKIAPTPLEKAEINKQYALYTISYMQERLNNELEKRKGSALELKDLPCIETVVDTVKGNQNPILRQGAIAALSHIARPEYNKYLAKIFEIAEQDEDERVRDAAAKALKNMETAGQYDNGRTENTQAKTA